MRKRPLFRRGRAVRYYDRGAQREGVHVFKLLRRVVTWELLALRGWGVTIIRSYRGDVVTWQFPGYEWAGSVRSMKKKRQQAANHDAQHLAAVESQLFQKLHPLIAHCAVTKYEDGDARKPGWWTLKTMGSAWVVEVKDPDTCMRLVVVQQTADEALMLASVLLESEEAPWEPDPWLSQQAAKNRKK